MTGRTVVSLMSDHDAETDHAAEIFVLDGEPKSPEALSGDDDVLLPR